jgi:hypothetical protein
MTVRLTGSAAACRLYIPRCNADKERLAGFLGMDEIVETEMARRTERGLHLHLPQLGLDVFGCVGCAA